MPAGSRGTSRWRESLSAVSAERRTSRSATIALGDAAGITRLYSGNLPSISFEVKRTSPIWARMWLLPMVIATSPSVPRRRCSSRTPLRGMMTCWPAGLGRQIHFAQCQTMAVSRDRSQHFPVRFQQHSIQVIANVLLRHREVRLVQEAPEIRLREIQCLLLRQLIDDREIRGGEGGEHKAAFSCFERHLVAVLGRMSASRRRAASDRCREAFGRAA